MLHILGVSISMVIAFGVIWSHPMETRSDVVSFFKFLSLWVLVVSTAAVAL